MATLWIREYENVGAAVAALPGGTFATNFSPKELAQEPGFDQTVTFSASTQSSAFASSTRYIAIIGSAAFHYVVGLNPTATTSALKVPADTMLFIGVVAGQKIAAILAA